jgi:hypothetical protein
MAEHHPLGDIEYLNENLLNSYLTGFPILKELIQNAEDAKASCLDYGWINGISNAKHPLLKCPALFMLDNGEFTNENAKSIRYILGGSSKPNQQDSIGKFGLGLKSVFHLCEAFFYIAPDITDCRYRTANIFNPWAGAENKDEYHENWDTFYDTDKELIKKSVNSILEKQDYQKQWFILWIPLRQRSHQTIQSEEDEVPLYIKKGDTDFFEETPPDFLGNPETKRQLNILMTLLGTVNQIRYWERDLNKPKFEVRLDQSLSQRRSSLSTLVHKQEHSIRGKIYEGENILSFAGSEVITETLEFTNIVKRPEFPEKFRYITAHNAIVFSQLSKDLFNNQSSLTLRTAVFLPIGEDYPIECESEYSYYLTLHGYFFVDFARTGILGWDKNNLNIDKKQVGKDDDRRTLLQKEWNFCLYQVILSRILENFNLFVNEYKLTESEVSALCKALHGSKLFKEKSSREIICQDKQFVLLVTSQDKKWKLLDRQRVLPLPEIPRWDLFLKLKEKAESSEWLLTLLNAPNLRFTNFGFDEWDDLKIIEVLSTLLAKDVLKDATAIKFLILFLKRSCRNSVIQSDKIQESLIKLLKEGLSQLFWNELNPNVREILKELVGLISTSRVIYIDIDEKIFRAFIKIQVNVLTLPTELFMDAPQNSTQLQFEDAEIFTLNLNSYITKVNNQEVNLLLYKNMLNILRQILVLSKENLNKILLKHQDCRCLIGQDYFQKEIKCYSYKEFQNLKNKSILFKKSSNQEKLIDSLVKASKDIKPVVVDGGIADVIKNITEISPVVCSTAVCRQILGSNDHPSLEEPEHRKQLLTELLKEVN